MPALLRIPIRVVCHAILRIDLVPSRVRALKDVVEQCCREGRGGDARLVEFVVDLSAPKQAPEEDPALHDLRFPFWAIARWLDAAGDTAPNPEPSQRTRRDVPKCLREPLHMSPALPDGPSAML